MPHVVLCDQPKNLSRFIQFAVAVSLAFDCAVVSGHIQMTYVPCSVEALICLDNLEYFSQAMKMLKMLATPKTRTPKLHSTGSSATLQSAQSAQSSSPSSRCDCHPLPLQLPVRLPSATNRATISQFSADLVRVC